MSIFKLTIRFKLTLLLIYFFQNLKSISRLAVWTDFFGLPRRNRWLDWLDWSRNNMSSKSNEVKNDADSDDETPSSTKKTIKNATDLQRLKLDKLLKQPVCNNKWVTFDLV